MTATTLLEQELLHALRRTPLDEFQIKASLGEAPFRIHAELLELERRELVYRVDDRWTLTASGLVEAIR